MALDFMTKIILFLSHHVTQIMYTDYKSEGTWPDFWRLSVGKFVQYITSMRAHRIGRSTTRKSLFVLRDVRSKLRTNIADTEPHRPFTIMSALFLTKYLIVGEPHWSF